MTLKQYIQNEDQRRHLFNWSWATTNPEKFKAYNKLLEDFLSKPEIEKINSKREIYFFWLLYCGTLQDYVLNEKPNGIVKKCPLTKKELKLLFGE